MGKQQDWSVTAYIFLFLSLASQIHCKNHFNSIRRVSLSTTTSGVNQQEPKEQDLIKRLPGQPPVTFRQYGGYVAVDETAGRLFYYYFTEAVKASDTAPLVLWLNGGPGCSSFGRGALMENGPFRVHSDGKTLFRNPYAFNNDANMLYLESPAKVGFSYVETPETRQSDNKTAEENYMFLVKWLERFPEYKEREFYISGQSYTGHYGPQLAQLILQRNTQTFINLRGVFLGSPGFDRVIEVRTENAYMLGHTLIPQKFVDEYIDCGMDTYTPTFDVEKCTEATMKIEAQKKGVSIYNIFAPMCKNATLTNKPKKGTTVMVYDPCSKEYVTAYLNSKKVQEAIHVKSTKLPYAWQHCSEKLSQSWNQRDIDGTVVPVLQEIMGRVRLFVYSGDLDLAVPVTGTMAVIKSMNLTMEKSWRQWYSGEEVGGFTEEYKRNFTFATVRAAGHSVAIDQPIRARTLFTSFIRNTPLPSAL